MSKNVQIDFQLFLDLVDYFSSDSPAPYKTEEIKEKLLNKMDKIANRELFTRYKRTPTGEEREWLRKMYLDRRGILDSFRSDEEISLEPDVED